MVATLLTAVVFYVVIPLLGAWHSRGVWARFRRSAFEALGYPEIDFSQLQSDSPLATQAFRLTGTFEAFEGTDRLWIGNERISVAVSLKKVPVYFLDDESQSLGYGLDPPRRADLSSLGALPEGTQFLVAGHLARDSLGQPHFSERDGRLLVLAFEGDSSTALARAVYAGRPAVDLWNAWTPVALGFGVLALLVLAYSGLRPGGDRSAGLVSLAVALLPVTFFLPPGILCFYAFARLWSQGREGRAWADLVSATNSASPLRPRWSAGARVQETLAYAFLLVGMVANALLLAVLVGLLLP